MQWEIDGDLDLVESSVDRAQDIIEANGWKVERSGPPAVREFRFASPEIGDIGRIKLRHLPNDRTDLSGYPPASPNDSWLVGYLPGNVPEEELGSPLHALLQVYRWQIENDIFDLPPQEYYRMGLANQKVDWGWERYGLVDKKLQEQAFEDMKAWQKRIHQWRIAEFEKILGVIEEQLKSDQLSLKKWDSRAAGRQQLEDNTGWDRELIEMWNEGSSRAEIARSVNVSKGRVTNRITELRNKFGAEIVPYDEDRKLHRRGKS